MEEIKNSVSENPDSQHSNNVGSGKKNGPKLNIKRTFLLGLAFMSISMFWQVYDSIMPLFLVDFGFSATWRGVIMALDNVLAIVLLPFMGIWSDRFPMKWRNKFGRRMPFIVVGSILAAIMFLVVNHAHNINALWLMLVVTAFLLVFMCLYRTPAVALTPDVTPKPIRSAANAIINMMATIGGMISLVLMSFLVRKEKQPDGTYLIFGNNWALIATISALMILSAVVMLIKVKENKFAEEAKKEMEKYEIVDDEEDLPAIEQTKKESKFKALGNLTKTQIVSLVFLLLSVFLWYMAYNGVTTHFSVFALTALKREDFTTPLLIANIAAFAMMYPASIIGKKLGRKYTVMLGLLLMIVGLGVGSIFMLSSVDVNTLTYLLYIVFALVGAGWATINVHSYVMCVELATEKTLGAYTGLYYVFSMSAQVITPILAGAVMDYISDIYLIPYAFVFVLLAFLTMIVVRYGNAQKVKLKTAENEEVNQTDNTDNQDNV